MFLQFSGVIGEYEDTGSSMQCRHGGRDWRRNAAAQRELPTSAWSGNSVHVRHARRARGRTGRRAAGQAQMTAGSRDLGPRWAALSAAGSSRRTPAPGRSQSKPLPRLPSGLRLRCGDDCRDFALMRSCVSPVGAPAPLWFEAPGRLVVPPNLLPCYTLSIRLAPIEHVTVASSTLTISRATHCGRAPKVLAAPCATGAAGPELQLA